MVTPVREWIATAREDKWGVIVDLVFAIVWVTMVDLIFQVIDGPTWAYYMLMLAGIVAYFGLFWNLELAKGSQEKDTSQ
ncbi:MULTISPECIES: hypothetical protein [Natronorubrum]|uniref:DUF8119 domain-containing protein n=2 Tax=Natronorubrum bangense TaxID=61858 RepID=L9WED9_9EURY|nr:hypothetical protein [Natronorubrum bangense]ELY47717.1 hypothetical protein C494_12691 [Natronorubrum bangense JCM 10635]QCC53491.1 hypothetical protein DV706_02725 [Natronorubrum bangense]